MANNNVIADVRTRRVRQPRPKSAHLNIGREREFTSRESPLLMNGDLTSLQKDIAISNEPGSGNNLSENDALLRKLRAL